MSPTALAGSPTSSRTLRSTSLKSVKSWARRPLRFQRPGLASSGQSWVWARLHTEAASSWLLPLQESRAQQASSPRDKGPEGTGKTAWGQRGRGRPGLGGHSAQPTDSPLLPPRIQPITCPPGKQASTCGHGMGQGSGVRSRLRYFPAESHPGKFLNLSVPWCPLL